MHIVRLDSGQYEDQEKRVLYRQKHFLSRDQFVRGCYRQRNSDNVDKYS